MNIDDNILLKMILALPIVLRTEPISQFIRNNDKYYARWNKLNRRDQFNG